MQKNTIHKVPTIDGIDELPDFNILLANFIENVITRQQYRGSKRGFFDPLEISELTGHANPSSIQSYSHNALQTQQ